MDMLKNKNSSENAVLSKCYLHSLVPSHRPVFDVLQYAKNRGGEPGPFYHINDVSVYQGRQRGGGVPRSRNTFVHTFFTLNQEQYVFWFANV